MIKERVRELVQIIEKNNLEYMRKQQFSTDLLMRYKLIVPDYDIDIDITNHVMNWDKLKANYARDKFTGVMNKQSTDVQICREPKLLLALLFEEHGLYTYARIQMMKRKRTGTFGYTYLTKPEIYESHVDMKLDFITYDERDRYLFINGQVDTLQEYIKAHKNVKYDIDVEDVKSKYSWNYDRIRMINTANFTFPEGAHVSNPHFPSSSHSVSFDIPIYSSGQAEVIPDTIPPLVNSVSFDFRYTEYETSPFFVAQESSAIQLKMNYNIAVLQDAVSKDYVRCCLKILDSNSQYKYGEEYYPLEVGDTYQFSIDRHLDINVEKGDKIIFYCRYKKVSRIEPIVVVYQSFAGECSISWSDKGQEMTLDVIDPKVLLQRIVKNMTKSGRFTAHIDWSDGMDYVPMLVAAESIRKLAKPIIHTSFYEFDDWMRTLGYENDFVGDDLIYRHVDKLFNPELTAIELHPRDVQSLKKVGNGNNAYTSVEIGYKKQNYDSVNGKFEVMGTFNYSTGYLNYRDNALKLISPYRADFLGIELLCWEALKKTTDTKSDNDVFVVALKYDETHKKYRAYSDKIITADKIELFNAPLTPEMLVIANESRIGVITDKLTFESTDAFREATKGREKIGRDMAITKKLFEPWVYVVNTAFRQDIPKDINNTGLVYIPYKGRVYKGYIKQMDEPYGTKTATEWEIHAVK